LNNLNRGRQSAYLEVTKSYVGHAGAGQYLKILYYLSIQNDLGNKKERTAREGAWGVWKGSGGNEYDM
jgi:hypothetical protein